MAQLSTKLSWDLANTKWASILNPIIALAILNGNQINDINLTSHIPQSINHLLGRMQQGWLITDINSNAVIWRTQPFNQYSIVLEASADTTISLWVF